jgi:hypothetical protein
MTLHTSPEKKITITLQIEMETEWKEKLITSTRVIGKRQDNNKFYLK